MTSLKSFTETMLKQFWQLVSLLGSLWHYPGLMVKSVRVQLWSGIEPKLHFDSGH